MPGKFTLALALLASVQCVTGSANALVYQTSAYSTRPATLSQRTHLTSPGPISAVWANDGGDKVTRDELRAKNAGRDVVNSVWDGQRVRIFGAKNEVVAFNLVLEAASAKADKVKVRLNKLTGPNGFIIKGDPTPTRAEAYNWVNRDIEMFFVRYLQIKGLSALSYETYDERHIPERFQRPTDSDGKPIGTWKDRPDRDKFYPDIAVPVEVKPTFAIPAGANQSIWADIYIPKNAPAGTYTGEVVISRGTKVDYRVPVSLTVRGFALPDKPTSKTMVYSSYEDIIRRYLGKTEAQPGSTEDKFVTSVMDRQMMVAHRHKISMIDENVGAGAWTQTKPRPEWVPRLNGTLFTAARGYKGPGQGVGNGVYSIGTYGAWQWWWGTPSEAKMRSNTDAWENWFRANAPSTERFLYLIDESVDYAQTETWANWINNNPGVGGNLKSFATAHLVHARENMPGLDISASWMDVGITEDWEQAATSVRQAGDKDYFMYNGRRPASGTFATEDDGVALRQLPWGQYKKGVGRWFKWQSTYYEDYQGGRGPTDVFVNAQTFGGSTSYDSERGMFGWNSSNGDGVLFYPGRDVVFPVHNYKLDGPMASLRLKHWRRGIQDVDYIALARAIDPAATDAIVDRMVPKALWEVGVTDPSDPTWVLAPISWSVDPDDWEAARKQLADIIERK